MNEAAVLQDIVRREGRSLLQYISEAFPWATFEDQASLVQLDAMISEERDEVASLSNFLAKLHVPLPYLGSYPMTFTNINYVSLDHLLPRLATYQQHAIAQLEQDLSQVADPAARKQVERILAMKREHLQKLQELTGAIAKPAAAVQS